MEYTQANRIKVVLSMAIGPVFMWIICRFVFDVQNMSQEPLVWLGMAAMSLAGLRAVIK